MKRTISLITEILEAGYKLEISPWMQNDLVVSIYNEDLKKGTHYHTFDCLAEPVGQQIEICLTNALHFINKDENE